jgi:glycosyltransferase involved in cell wall biosynthesis
MAHPARAEYDNPTLREAVEAELQQFQPDVVHVMHAMKFSASALLACHEDGAPFIVTLCDFWFLCPRHTLLKPDGTLCSGPSTPWRCVPCLQQLHEFALWPQRPRQISQFARDLKAIAQRTGFLKQSLLHAERIIALTAFTKSKFVEYGIPANRIEVIPHGLEIDDLNFDCVNKSTPEYSSPLRVGFIGSLVPHKGAHLLIEALKQIPESDIQCLIYGAPRDDEYCRKLQAESAQDTRIKFMGGFAPQELGRVLKNVDVLAVPALWYENDPLVVKAAFHVGKPVLANKIGSLAEMIAEGRNGWLLGEHTPERWSEALKNLATYPSPIFAPMPMKTMDENAVEMLSIYQQVCR